jgi:predicted ATPase
MKDSGISHSRKLVLTGGPCAGKSTIAEVLGRAFSDKVIVVPESASVLFRGGFPRWPEESARAALQSAIYHVQVAVENAYDGHYSGALSVFDRGTIDGAAYWPEGPEAFFRAMGTTEARELARYDRVIFLESADQSDYERHRKKNPVRNENWEQAHALDTMTRQIWARHPNIAFVKNQSSFVDKVFSVLKLIENELDQAKPYSTKK